MEKINNYKVDELNESRVAERIGVPVSTIEFSPGSNTIWVKNLKGSTAIQIVCSGEILIDKCTNSPVSHCDLLVPGSIMFSESIEKQNPSIELITIPVGIAEFNIGGNTIWIQSPLGGTSMRIKCSGAIGIKKWLDESDYFSNISVDGNIEFCISADAYTIGS